MFQGALEWSGISVGWAWVWIQGFCHMSEAVVSFGCLARANVHRQSPMLAAIYYRCQLK